MPEKSSSNVARKASGMAQQTTTHSSPQEMTCINVCVVFGIHFPKHCISVTWNMFAELISRKLHYTHLLVIQKLHEILSWNYFPEKSHFSFIKLCFRNCCRNNFRSVTLQLKLLYGFGGRGAQSFIEGRILEVTARFLS